MKYYKRNSIPLEEDYPSTGDISFDENGNQVIFGVFEEPVVLTVTVLEKGQKISEYEKENFLKAYWSWMNKKIEGKDGIYHANEEE